jgi:plastocyanin
LGSKRRSALVAIAVVLAVSPAAFAARGTTAPSKRVTIVVRISDTGIAPLAQFTVAGTGDLLKVAPAGSRVPRGDYATFTVFNHGKKRHNFTILNRKTGVIKPGGRAHFNIYFKVRGHFRYASTLDHG